MSNHNIALSSPVVMKLQPEWFQNGYYVYVVVINHREKRYYYIGMTGDRKHLVARSPFYRMSGHFMLSKSTQNQIIKGIKNILGIDIKVNTDMLCEMNIAYYAWLIKPFIKQPSESDHHTNREIGEKIESALIKKCQKVFREENVFNKNLSQKKFEEYQVYAEEIFQQLKDHINE
jgi:hypothetical protein